METTLRRRSLAALAGLAAFVALAGALPAHAQGAYPNKPIRIIVPFPAGGSTDAMARNLGAELTKQMGQPVVVENRPGVNGNLGSDHVAKSPADGYTLLLTGVGTNAINHGLYANMPYDSNRDFAHITLLAEGPNVLVVHPSFAAKSIPELVAMAKAQPGKLAYASNGNGSSGRMAMEMLRQATGIDMLHVPYKGGGPSMTDLIGGQVPMLFTNQDHALPQVQAGKVRAIGVASLKRNPAYPNVPTVAEQGLPGFAAVSWFGLAAPAKTPPEIVRKLHEETLKALALPEFRSKLEQVGFVVVGNTPAEVTAFVAAEVDKWAKVVKTAGATVD